VDPGRLPDFDRIYLDTSILRKSNWPHVSTELRFLFELARNFAIDVVIPEPVEIEREEQWFRDLTAATQKCRSAHSRRADMLKVAGVGVDEPREDAPETFREKYRAAAELSKKTNGIKTIPTTTRSVTDFLKLAVTRTAPFQYSGDKVTGFQDAAILLSILDDLTVCDRARCTLLSEDDVFSKIEAVSAAEGKAIRHLRTIDDIWKILAEEIKPEAVKWWETQRSAIRAEVTAQQEQIKQIVQAFVRPDMISPRARSIQSIGLPRVIVVEIPFPRLPLEPGPYQTIEGATLKISATLSVEVQAFASPGLDGLASLLARQFSDRPGSGTKTVESEELRSESFSKIVEMEGTAVFERGRYDIRDLKVVSVS
jgi:PIN domain